MPVTPIAAMALISFRNVRRVLIGGPPRPAFCLRMGGRRQGGGGHGRETGAAALSQARRRAAVGRRDGAGRGGPAAGGRAMGARLWRGLPRLWTAVAL